ncbi:MAG: SusD/RagB family nutrient-binding outer membrane lipoprotein [Bacteroidota bacterium]
MIRTIVAMLTLAVVLGACTKDFEKINIDPNRPVQVPLDFLLGQTQLQIAGSANDPGYKTWRGNFIYAATISQQMASANSFYAGDKYLYDANNSGAYFVDSYANAIKNLVNLIDQAKKDPKNVNILSVARILKAFQTHLITDLYGDVPYSEAGLGYLQQNFSPKYDLQKDIYADMLKELDEAGKALTTSAAFPPTADFVYGGDLNKWKKFANSLMLRLAMRMQKADPATAQTWIKKAIDGGVMESNDDSFAIKHTAGAIYSNNSNSFTLGTFAGSRNVNALDNILWSKTLIDLMKSRNDPRLNIIASVADGDMAPAKQKGLPNGYDNSTGTPHSLATFGDPNLKNYSRPSPLMIDANDPNIFLAYAETRFLTAEAIERTWVAGVAASEYQKGQEAALAILQLYDPLATITNTAAYTAANPYPIAGTLADKLTQIHSEMFILTASTLNFYEGFANYRRTGIPNLVPVNYPGNQTGGQIPRRLRYPQTEAAVNPNYTIANDRQGGDSFLSKVWWDK